MAKDPATLFYWNDWNSGTILMSRFLKGCFIDVLHAQFNHGHLSLEEIKTCLGSDFGSSWLSLQKKFKQDENGLFFNERLDIEIEKRKAFVESRKHNGSKGGRPKKPNGYPNDKPNDKANDNLTENENENRNDIEIRIFRIEDCLRISLNDSRWVKANKTEQAEVEKFNEYLEKQGIYEMNPLDYKRYFAKLKGKYPDLIKRVFTIEDYRRMAKEYDEMQKKTA